MPTSLEIRLDGRPCIVPARRREARWANSYWCPLGPAAGRAWLLLSRRDAAAIVAGGRTYHELSFASVDESGRKQEAVFRSLVWVKSYRTRGGAAGDEDAAYAVELADRRYLVERFSDSGWVSCNVRSWSQPGDFLSGTGGRTWSDLAGGLWQTMAGVLGPFPGLPAGAAASGRPENVRFLGQNAWRALATVLQQIGCAAAYLPLDDRFEIVNLASAQAEIAGLEGAAKLLDADPLEQPGVVLPETVRVYFATHYRNFGQERDTERENNWSVREAVFAVDVPSGAAGAAAGTVVPLWDSLPRVLNEQNEVENADAIAARAAERAASWIAARRTGGRRLHYVMPGIVTLCQPGSQAKAVLWRAFGAGGGTATEIVCHPGLPRRVRGGESLSGGLVWDDGGESFERPDLARRSFPVFPRLPNFVQADDGHSRTGERLSPNSAGVTSGFVVRYVAGGIERLEPCWILACGLEICDTPRSDDPVVLRQGDCYYGRLSGIKTAAGETRPLYVVEGERWWPRLTGGPQDSLFWQGPGGRLPQWHTTPRVKTGLHVGTANTYPAWLRLGQGFPVYHLNPPSGGGQKIRWPTADPPGINSHLYIDAKQGKGLQTEWGYQGCDADVYLDAGTSCGTKTCVYFQVRKGIVTNIQGLSVNPAAGDHGTVNSTIHLDSPYDPCTPSGKGLYFLADVVFETLSAAPLSVL